ncbi:HEAT repeat domain-containing protein [Streptomyces californicus]|uniref:HEAT repeat domain-containing protein n=1 Tax=Streptomyces californicus TaxID=67351 RepID=UPI0036EB76DB
MRGVAGVDGWDCWDGEAVRAVVRVCEGATPAEAFDTASADAWLAFDAGARCMDDRPWLSHAPAGAPGRPGRSAPTLLDRLRGRRGSPLASPVPPPPPAVALCHPDGRVREAALEAVRSAPELRPLLVVRCADWATPVRERARTLLAELPGVALFPLAELVLRLARRERGGFARALLEAALREGPAAGVLALTARQDRATYRLAYRIAVERGLLTPMELAATAATSGDVTIQDLCADAAVAVRAEGGGPAPDPAVLDRLLTARSPRVRSAGVTALRRAGRCRDAEPYLADRSALVRACARYVLRQGGDDPLPRYRAWCAEAAGRPAAAAGLGECGDRAVDAARLWALLEHPSPAVRLHAVTGLRALDAVVRERLTPLLDDPSPAVVRAATRALLPDAAGIPEPLLRERTAPDRPRAVRVAAERLLRAAGRHRWPGPGRP